MGFSAINQYLSAIRTLVDDQFNADLITLRRGDLMTTKMTNLIKVVKNRGERVMKKQFKERLSEEFQPYRVLEDVPKIEEYTWSEHSNTKVYGANALRDRFQMLFSFSAVLRSDSIYKADLSDLCDFKFQQKLEPDPYHVCILRVGEGKTVQKKAQFGKMMRHANVKMCAIGALGFWLYARFLITNEINSIDWTNNQTWFNIKLLCAVNKNNAKTYCKFVCTVIYCFHFLQCDKCIFVPNNLIFCVFTFF